MAANAFQLVRGKASKSQTLALMKSRIVMMVFMDVAIKDPILAIILQCASKIL